MKIICPDAPNLAQFTAGEKLCLLTLIPAHDCPHCDDLRRDGPHGPVVTVAEVDREAGILTLSTR